MANIASAEKQNRKMIKHRARNRAAMASLRTAVDDKSADAVKLVKSAISIIDSAVSKGILKRRTRATCRASRPVPPRRSKPRAARRRCAFCFRHSSREHANARDDFVFAHVSVTLAMGTRLGS